MKRLTKRPQIYDSILLLLVVSCLIAINVTNGVYWWLKLSTTILMSHFLFDVGVSYGYAHGMSRAVDACRKRSCGECPFILEEHEDRPFVPE